MGQTHKTFQRLNSFYYFFFSFSFEMLHFIFFKAVLVFTIVLGALPEADAETILELRSEYIISETINTWEDAFEACREMGGILATFQTREKQDLMMELIKRTYTDESNRFGYWIGSRKGNGGFEERGRGGWKWWTGETISGNGDFKWKRRYSPITWGCLYLAVNPTQDGDGFDPERCNWRKRFICEKPLSYAFQCIKCRL